MKTMNITKAYYCFDQLAVDREKTPFPLFMEREIYDHALYGLKGTWNAKTLHEQ